MMQAALATDLDWTVVNDTVMGGVSSGALTVEETVRFTGTLSMDQGGGFVSIRSQGAALAGATGLRVHLRGDGRTWDLTLRRSDVPIRAGSYRVAIPTTPGVQAIEVALKDFRPTSFGRPISGAPALDAAPGRIDSVGFLLADRRPGAFELEIVSIEPLLGATPRAPGHTDVLAALQAALSVGVPAFNAGDPAKCRDVYAAALASARAHPALTAGERSLIDEALAAAGGPPEAAAWALRNGIDSLLAGAR